jgi:ATP-dependent Lon protease
VKTLILPEENRADYEDLDPEIRKGITAHFVRSFDEVRKICFPGDSGVAGRRRPPRSRGEDAPRG